MAIAGDGKHTWPARHRILFLDAYDSFTNNITSLLSTLLDVDVFVLPIDTPLLDPGSPDFQDELRRELSHYAAVVCGPGPGSPDNERDVGLMRHIWALADDAVVPTLGVCLGFQSLVAGFGGTIRRLERGLHGMVRQIEHRGCSSRDGEAGIFAGVGRFRATLYHSLCADIGQARIPQEEWEERRWEASKDAPDLLPLAWVEEEREGGRERILMAVKHSSQPFWGLQYHPESVCTEDEGHRVICRWFEEALRWNETAGRMMKHDGNILADDSVRPSLLSQMPGEFRTRLEEEDGIVDWSRPGTALWTTFGRDHEYDCRRLDLPGGVEIPDIVETLQAKATEAIILESANASTTSDRAAADVKGRYSIIALDVAEALRLEHHVGDWFATARLPAVLGVQVDASEQIPLKGRRDIWPLLAGFQAARSIDPAGGLPDLPFLGGFMGYITYEQGLSNIGVRFAEDRGHKRPDICLAWITKSIVIDHATGLMYIQQLRPKASGGVSWIDDVVSAFRTSHLWQHPLCDSLSGEAREGRDSVFCSEGGLRKQQTSIRIPNSAEYERRVGMCQEYIAAGHSYELCLTDQTTITRPRSDVAHPAPEQPQRQPEIRVPGSWQLYRTLRKRQPAPFASYLRLGGATLVSSSPERFLQHDRRGLCSMRPMKGTVRKSASVSTLAAAERILHVPKEEAENLMIVDLVRHDVHGVCGAGNVRVPELLKVEEYRSVFQMITVVEGQLPRAEAGQHEDREGGYTGLDVLAASLPPGSMTGAPKKRSCELLQEIETRKERSLYSGVVGYMDVTGRGDWSVTIRSMFRWDDEEADGSAAAGEGVEGGGRGGTEVWHIGAGGAVTILSTPEGEREEMLTKLAGPLGIFS